MAEHPPPPLFRWTKAAFPRAHYVSSKERSRSACKMPGRFSFCREGAVDLEFAEIRGLADPSKMPTFGDNLPHAIVSALLLAPIDVPQGSEPNACHAPGRQRNDRNAANVRTDSQPRATTGMAES
jgi:hypothetical protein